MTIESEIYDRLVADAGVGAVAGDRIHWPHLPAHDVESLPAVTFTRISSDRPSSMGTDDGLVDSIWQFDCWAETPDAAANLRDACRQSLQRWSAPSGDPAVEQAFIEDERDHGLDPDLRIHRAALDVRIWFRE